jgi:PAS domain S-box-containing protein
MTDAPSEMPTPPDRPEAAPIRGFLEALSIAVYELDRSGRIIYTNPAYASITGYGVDELLGTRG